MNTFTYTIDPFSSSEGERAHACARPEFTQEQFNDAVSRATAEIISKCEAAIERANKLADEHAAATLACNERAVEHCDAMLLLNSEREQLRALVNAGLARSKAMVQGFRQRN